MLANEMMVIDDFMTLSDLLDDDIDMICDFIRDKIPKSIKRYKRSRVKSFIERADYIKIDAEIEYLLGLNSIEYKTYVIYYRIVKKIERARKGFVQTKWDDYMWTR